MNAMPINSRSIGIILAIAACGACHRRVPQPPIASLTPTPVFADCGVYWDEEHVAILGRVAEEQAPAGLIDEVVFTDEYGATLGSVSGMEYVEITGSAFAYSAFLGLSKNELAAIQKSAAKALVTIGGAPAGECGVLPAHGRLTALGYDNCPHCLDIFLCRCLEADFDFVPEFDACNSLTGAEVQCAELATIH